MNKHLDLSATQTVLDAIPTAKLMAELEAKRTSFYKAIALLKIQTFMDGKTSMVRTEDAQKLRDHYQSKTVEINGEPVKTITLSELENRQADKRTNEIIPLIQALSAFIPQPVCDPFAQQRHLQEACDRKWILESTQLAQILGLKNIQHLRGNKETFFRYGFELCRVGKNGRSDLWKISKTI
jgi:hypothetical protein